MWVKEKSFFTFKTKTSYNKEVIKNNLKFLFIKKQNGQVAIFVALVFQVLFVLFAMIVNVGLMVHQKIALQNSLDLATYYAAMKQAEVLSAVAHINYQIRQSYKLMNFRYNIVGAMGAKDHPIAPYAPYKTSFSEPMNDEKMAKVTVFCTALNPSFANAPPGDNLCKEREARTVQGLTVPPVTTTFFNIFQNVANNIQNLQNLGNATMESFGTINFWTLAQVITGYRADVLQRKKAIKVIADNISNNMQDFVDLEGESVLLGARKTFEKNLPENQKANILTFDLFNSLASGDCGSIGGGKAPRWLSEIIIYPIYRYQDTLVTPGQTSNFDIKNKWTHSQGPDALPFHAGLAVNAPLVLPFADYVGAPVDAKDWVDSIGYEKDPWCVAYVGLRAQVSVKLPFMPVDFAIPLSATSFAKAFGGRIGPWYHKTWNRAENRSNGGPNDKTDALLQPRQNVNGSIPNLNDPEREPNYSRFPGDQAGILSKTLIRELTLKAFDPKALYGGAVPNGWDLGIWARDGQIDTVAEGDILAFHQDPTTGWEIMRNLELMSLAPDIFDLNYYSIDANYTASMRPKLEKFFTKFAPSLLVPGDFGWRKGEQAFEKMAVRDQINLFAGSDPFFGTPGLSKTVVYHTVQNVDNLLNSWVTRNLNDYSLNASLGNQPFFGKCHLRRSPSQENSHPPTLGDCIGGGRSSYSVKFVSPEWLKSGDLVLGGPNSAPGTLKNPPPDGF